MAEIVLKNIKDLLQMRRSARLFGKKTDRKESNLEVTEEGAVAVQISISLLWARVCACWPLRLRKIYYTAYDCRSENRLFLASFISMESLLMMSHQKTEIIAMVFQKLCAVIQISDRLWQYGAYSELKRSTSYWREGPCSCRNILGITVNIFWIVSQRQFLVVSVSVAINAIVRDPKVLSLMDEPLKSWCKAEKSVYRDH